MTPAEIRAEPLRVHGHIDAELDDEHRDSQYVLEQVADDLNRLIAAINITGKEK
ncbi:hypothetical protein [Nonomuraea sp. NPDC049646]|uniref:hypothetical protein n=1 Tax=unclassified Nonomuraea TaxID=2593643 RepID=UPI0037B05F41